MSEERVIATYHLESPLDLHKAAHALAKEQSTGTWVSVGAETEEVMRRHGAEVLEVEVSETDTPSPSLPTRLDHPGPYRACKITVAFPCINFGSVSMERQILHLKHRKSSRTHPPFSNHKRKSNPQLCARPILGNTCQS